MISTTGPPWKSPGVGGVLIFVEDKLHMCLWDNATKPKYKLLSWMNEVYGSGQESDSSKLCWSNYTENSSVFPSMVFSEPEVARMKLIKYKKQFASLETAVSYTRMETGNQHSIWGEKKRLVGAVQLPGFSGFVPGLVNNEVISHTGNTSGETGEKVH